MGERYAILVDGGFLTKQLLGSLNRFPTEGDILQEIHRIQARPELATHSLLRVYFYDAMPVDYTLINPFDNSRFNLSITERYKDYKELLSKLELSPFFALRLGELVIRGWQISDRALSTLLSEQRPPTALDFVPKIEQKGVDLRIGLDIARLSLRRMVQTIVVITGDSDMIPAFKFARREGLRVYLDCLGHTVRRDLIAHADLMI